MGAADYPAGSFPSGVGDLTPSDRAVATLGQAPLYDPFDRAYVLATDLSVEMTHPVMHRAAHLLGIRRGALRHTPNDGMPQEGLRNATALTAQAEAEDAVARAIAPLLAAGDVAIVKVTAVVNPWRGVVHTDIKNLRDPSARPVRFTTRVTP